MKNQFGGKIKTIMQPLKRWAVVKIKKAKGAKSVS